MKNKMYLLGILFAFSHFIYAQNIEVPNWINKTIFIENEKVYFVGYSEVGITMDMTLRHAQSKGIEQLLQKIQNDMLSHNELIIDEYYLITLPPIPVEAKSRLKFKSIKNQTSKIWVNISDVSVVESWKDNNNRIYVLFSSTGIEIEYEEFYDKLMDMGFDEICNYIIELENKLIEIKISRKKSIGDMTFNEILSYVMELEKKLKEKQ